MAFSWGAKNIIPSCPMTKSTYCSAVFRTNRVLMSRDEFGTATCPTISAGLSRCLATMAMARTIGTEANVAFRITRRNLSSSVSQASGIQVISSDPPKKTRPANAQLDTSTTRNGHSSAEKPNTAVPRRWLRLRMAAWTFWALSPDSVLVRWFTSVIVACGGCSGGRPSLFRGLRCRPVVHSFRSRMLHTKCGGAWLLNFLQCSADCRRDGLRHLSIGGKRTKQVHLSNLPVDGSMSRLVATGARGLMSPQSRDMNIPATGSGTDERNPPWPAP